MATHAEINEQVARGLGWVFGDKFGVQNWRHPDGRCNLPDFCTDIRAAWEPILFMRKKGFVFSLADFNGGFSCQFFKQEGEQRFRYRAEAKTEALAICLAFLKSL